MTNGWQTVPLRQVLKLDLAKVPLDAGTTYPMVGVYSFGRGLFLREPVSGNNTSYKFFYQLKAEHIVMSQLFGWEGALALSSEKFDGLFVSPQFPTFLCDESKLDREFLGWIMRRKSFWEDLGSRTKGMGDRRRTLNPEALFATEIPLPPLTEQRRIVAHIESLAARVNEARRLREEAEKETDKLHGSTARNLFSELSEQHQSMPIGRTFDFRNDVIHPTDHKVGRLRFIGLQHVEPNTGKRIGEDTLYAEKMTGRKFNFSPGEIVYGYLRPYLNKVWIADCDGVCSVDQYVLKPKSKIIDTEYLAYFMRSPVFLEKAIELTHNLLLPRLRSGLLSNILIPVPPLDEQRSIVTYLDGLQAKVHALRELQVKSGEELSALMPSILDKAFKGDF